MLVMDIVVDVPACSSSSNEAHPSPCSCEELEPARWWWWWGWGWCPVCIVVGAVPVITVGAPVWKAFITTGAPWLWLANDLATGEVIWPWTLLWLANGMLPADWMLFVTGGEEGGDWVGEVNCLGDAALFGDSSRFSDWNIKWKVKGYWMAKWMQKIVQF